MPLGITYPLPHSLRAKVLSYKICPLFTHSICYWDACISFQVFCWDKFSAGDYSMGEVFVGTEVSRECTCRGKLYIAGICQNSYTQFFLCVLLSLFRLNFMRSG